MTAMLAVPTNYDSMTYHLARVAHWAQNQGVMFYPTNIVRQLYQPPWAEFAMLQFFLLGGGDRLVSLAQWLSMVGSVVGVSVIARELGAGPTGQMLSAFLCATIPMGILQASSTQNDYVAAFWLVCFVHSLLVLRSRSSLGTVLAAGTSLGLALLTKGTGYIFAAAFVFGLLLPGSVRAVPLRVKQALVIGLCALALNAPQYARNVELFGTPLGQNAAGEPYINEQFSLSIVCSNAIRNIGLHLGSPWPQMNALLERGMRTLHGGMGIPLDDPRATWPGQHFEIKPPTRSEDLAGNGPHLLLIIASASVLAWRWQPTQRRRVRYLTCLTLAFLLFCLLLRYQPWHSRLHLPLFVLAAPLGAAVFERLNARVLLVVAAVLAALSWVYLTDNESRPLAGPRAVYKVARLAQRVEHTRWLRPEYLGAAAFLRSTGCVHVGLLLGPNDPEYALWDLLPEVRLQGRFEHVPVSNVSARLANRKAPFYACAIIRVLDAPIETLTVGAQMYRNGWASGIVQVLVESRDGASTPPDRSRPGPEQLVSGMVVQFQPGRFDGSVLLSGWSTPEMWGVWSGPRRPASCLTRDEPGIGQAMGTSS
jgi:4-amino-4-deoxy-L-arabinose transferase-like glycosyltransferase